jgi:pimeloyl-ACP methyl ester carboxylesterase
MLTLKRGAIVAWKFAQKFPEMTTKLTIINVPHPAAFGWLFESKKWDIIQTQAKKSWYILFFQLPSPLPEFRFARNDYATLKSIHIPLAKKKIVSSKMLDRYVQAYSEPNAVHSMMNYYRALISGKVVTRIMSLFNPDPLVEKYVADDKVAITKPTMIIWGTADVALEFELAKLSYEKGVSEDVKRASRFVPVEGAAHFVTNDRSEEVCKLLTEFLQ